METRDHYFWKFHSFPAVPMSYEYAAWEGTDMTGYYACIPYRYRIGETMATAGMVCDVMTGVKARGKGIFTKLGYYSTDAMANEALDFAIGYPIRPEVIPGHIKVKWKIAYEMPIYIRFLKLTSLLKKKKLGFLAPIGNKLLKLYNSLFVNNEINSDYVINIIEQDYFFKLKNYEKFFEDWQKTVSNSLMKTMEFMQWRLSAPGSTYKIVTIHKHGHLVAVAVTRKSVMEGITVLAIIDMMLIPGNETCLPALNQSLFEISKNYEAEAIVTMMSKTWAKNYRLRGFGFVPSPYKFRLIIKKLNDKLSDALLFNEVNWHLMWIDSDDL